MHEQAIQYSAEKRNQHPESIRTFVEAPRFDQLVAEAGLGLRQNTIQYEGYQVTPHGVLCKAQEGVVTEGQALVVLDNFLTDAEMAAARSGDTEVEEMASNMRVNVPYMGVREFAKASQGISDYWGAYLEQSDDNAIVVYSPAEHGDKKSSGYVAASIWSVLHTKDSRLAARVWRADDDSLADSISGRNPDNVKVLVVDDWMGDGNMLRADARQAAGSLLRAGMAAYIDRIEGNLLMMTSKQAQQEHPFIAGNTSGAQPLPIVAYYESTVPPEAKWRPFGSHCSNDRNDGLLVMLAKARARDAGENVPLPPSYYVSKPYKQYN